MTLNLNQMTLTRPALGHGAVAAARLPFVAAGDANALAQAAASIGMVSVGPNQFQHPLDGSWVALNGTRIDRGVGNIMFRGVPANLAALPVIAGTTPCAAAQIQPGATGAALTAALTQAGFAESSKGFFAHPDRSWVAVTPDAGVLRGVGQQLLAPAPATGTRTTAQTTRQAAQPAQQPTQQAATGPTAAGVLQYAQKNAAFEDGFLACAMPGRLDPRQLAALTPQLTQQGFVQTSPGYFEHPGDKSWVAFTGTTIERGVGNQRFVRVPVNPTRLAQVAPPPNAFALAVANPALQKLTLAQVQKSDKPLLDAGFANKGNGVYAHADGSFLAFSTAQTWIGQNQQIFTQAPLPLSAQTAVKSSPAHGYLALAQTGKLDPKSATLAQTLGGLGFSATIPGSLYSHTDGSWVALQGGALYRGVGTTLLSDVPVPPPPGSAVKDTSRPALPNTSDWAWWKSNMAIGKLPLLGGGNANDLQALRSLGFVQIGAEWWHPDGSWVDFGQRPPLGWKGYHLGQLPYNNRTPGR